MNTFVCEKGCCKFHITNWMRPRYTSFKRGIKINRKKAGVFVYDPTSRKVLLVQSCGKLWGPPKGSMEENETFEACAQRELLEETGMTVDNDIYQNPIFVKNNAVYFYAEVDEKDCRVQNSVGNNDANGIGWFNVECLLDCINTGKIKVNQHLKLTFKQFLGIPLI